MDQNRKRNTVNTRIDITKKYGNFTFEDILDGIFSQEEMNTWQAADWDVKENKTKKEPLFLTKLFNNFSYIPVLSWASFLILQFSPYYCYSVHTGIAVFLTLAVRHLAVILFSNC